jgi:hypothetical protein
MINPLLESTKAGDIRRVEQFVTTATQTHKDQALLVATQKHELDIAALLLEHHANVEARNPLCFNTSPLMHAVCLQDKAMVSLLLKYGADMQAENDDKKSAMAYAESARHNPVMHGTTKDCADHIYGLLLGKEYYDTLCMSEMSFSEFTTYFQKTTSLNHHIKVGIYKHALSLAGGSADNELLMLQKLIAVNNNNQPKHLLSLFMRTLVFSQGEALNDSVTIEHIKRKIDTLQKSLETASPEQKERYSYFWKSETAYRERFATTLKPIQGNLASDDVL